MRERVCPGFGPGGHHLIGRGRPGAGAGGQAFGRPGRKFPGPAPAEAWAGLADKTKAETKAEDGFEADLNDLGGRLNLNLLVDSKGQIQAMWVGVMERLLGLLGRDPDLVQSLLDWLDPDSETRTGGAEAREYSELGQKIAPRNGPLLDIREIGLIKGFDQDLLQGEEERPGLLELVSAFGGPRINVNTAPAFVLRALDTGMRESLVKGVIELREERPIRKLTELRGLVGMSPDQYKIISPMLDVKSSWFEARAVGRAGRARHRLRVILERKQKQVRVISGEIG
ncbi:MAG: general secretion pathway protein GspK [Deltaproteobacteria bacterium]|nr:general secretion pathway protein GspK [Deltaproteobacteria bacterium]